jgi:hypothetical protein
MRVREHCRIQWPPFFLDSVVNLGGLPVSESVDCYHWEVVTTNNNRPSIANISLVKLSENKHVFHHFPRLCILCAAFKIPLVVVLSASYPGKMGRKLRRWLNWLVCGVLERKTLPLSFHFTSLHCISTTRYKYTAVLRRISCCAIWKIYVLFLFFVFISLVCNTESQFSTTSLRQFLLSTVFNHSAN